MNCKLMQVIEWLVSEKSAISAHSKVILLWISAVFATIRPAHRSARQNYYYETSELCNK